MNTPLILVLPELGGIGKSSLSEQLVAIAEIGGQDVVALDGDPSSRGLVARRRGRKTTSIVWPAEPVSRAAAIRNAARGKVAVLDFGAGSSQTLSVDPTIADLCDGAVVDGVETVLMLIGEASKPGNAQAISRLRRSFPKVHAIFVKSFKSGGDFSSFRDCSDLPIVDLDAVPVAVMEWLSNHRMALDPHTGEASRPALADLVMTPEAGYETIGKYLAWMLIRLSRQPPIRDMFGWNPVSGGRPLGTSLVLQRGPMTNTYLAAHEVACARLREIMESSGPGKDVQGWVAAAGRKVLDFVRARDTMDAERRSPSRPAM